MQKLRNHHRRVGESGSARGVVFILVLVLGLLWAGAQKIHTALTNRNPAMMSYEAYAQSKPSAKWLVITNCQLNLLRSCYLSYYAGQQNPTEYYIPVRDQDSTASKVSILLKTSDPELLATIAEIKGLKSESALVDWIGKNRSRVFPRRNIQGLVCFGIDLKSHDRDELARVEKNLTEDFIILDAKAQPNLTAGISYSAAGLASLFGLVAYARRALRDDQSDDVP